MYFYPRALTDVDITRHVFVSANNSPFALEDNLKSAEKIKDTNIFEGNN